jgi:hypothetical protein
MRYKSITRNVHTNAWKLVEISFVNKFDYMQFGGSNEQWNLYKTTREWMDSFVNSNTRPKKASKRLRKRLWALCFDKVCVLEIYNKGIYRN